MAMLDFAENNVVRPSRFVICYSGDLSGNTSEEKASVAICGGLIASRTGGGTPYTPSGKLLR